MQGPILIFLSAFISVSTLAQDQWKNVYREEAWSERDSWQRADDLIRKLQLRAGSLVADVGCNEGYMTMKLSKTVGPLGKVFAVDINASKLDLLKAHLGEKDITNVNVVKGGYDNPNLPVNTLDAVIIVDSYHEMGDHDEMLRHIRLSLRTGGSLLLCEPIAENRRKLSRAEQEARHELGINYALADLQVAGFEIIFRQDRYVDRSKIKGDMMWVILAVKRG